MNFFLTHFILLGFVAFAWWVQKACRNMPVYAHDTTKTVPVTYLPPSAKPKKYRAKAVKVASIQPGIVIEPPCIKPEPAKVELLTGALLGLGYKKVTAVKAIQSLGVKINDMSPSDAVKELLCKLSQS